MKIDAIDNDFSLTDDQWYIFCNIKNKRLYFKNIKIRISGTET